MAKPVAVVHNERVARDTKTALSPLTGETPGVKCARTQRLPNTGAILGKCLENNMSDRYGTNTNVMRIVNVGERIVIWGSP